MQDLSVQKKIPELDEMYEFAEREGVHVIGYRLPLTQAVSVMDRSGNCVVGLDNSKVYSRTDKKTMLAHELGHCMTGAFYNEHSPLSLRSKCERKASEWAILKCVPYTALIDALQGGLGTHFELAEHFGVSEAFIAKAIEYYLQKREEQNASV